MPSSSVDLPVLRRNFARGVTSSVRRGLKRDKALAVAAAAAATGDEAAMAAAAKAVPMQDYMGLARLGAMKIQQFMMVKL